MNVGLPSELAAFLEGEVASSQYGAAGELVRLLRREREEHERKMAILRREVQIGVDDVGAGRISDFRRGGHRGGDACRGSGRSQAPRSSGKGSYRLGAAAARDIAAILEQTEAQFGLRQHDACEARLGSAIRLVAAGPARLGSNDRGHLGPGMRSFAVALAAGRRRAAAHVPFCVPDRARGRGILVARVLHRPLGPRLRLPDAPH